MEVEQSLWLQRVLCPTADRPASQMGQIAIGSQLQQVTGPEPC